MTRDSPTTGRYAYAQGTSFAAPIVSAIAALVLQANPALHASQVPEHGMSQQTPLAQEPLWHWAPAVHAAPCGRPPPAPLELEDDDEVVAPVLLELEELEEDDAAAPPVPLELEDDVTVAPPVPLPLEEDVFAPPVPLPLDGL